MMESNTFRLYCKFGRNSAVIAGVSYFLITVCALFSPESVMSYVASKNYFNECNNIVQRDNKWLFAGCSYWESLLEDSKKKKIKLLKKASNLPRTLYGQLAIEKLNISDPFSWRNDTNKMKVNFSYLNENRIFKRAIALTEVGLYNHADLEIRNLYSKMQKMN